ncbi:hypothetical protein V8E36_007262 [Tilletia maclaganii]
MGNTDRPRASFSGMFSALLSCLALSLPASVLCSRVRCTFSSPPFFSPLSRLSSSLDETLRVYKPTCMSPYLVVFLSATMFLSHCPLI